MIRYKHYLICPGSVSEFKKKFENPILRGRDADASDADHKKGTEKLVEVNNLQELHNNYYDINYFMHVFKTILLYYFQWTAHVKI